MYNFFRKNQKKLMAVFGVVLMIAFIIPTATTRMANQYQNVVGQIGKDKVTAEQIREAQSELNFLSQHVALRQTSQDGTRQQWVPITAAVLPQTVLEQMQGNQNTELYYLLQAEARKMGLSPNLERVNQELSQPSIGIRMPDGSFTDINRVEQVDEPLANNVRYSLANLLMVSDAFGRALDAVKISEPMQKFVIAQQLQQVKERLVDFPAKDYESKVPAPTAEQLQDQFNKFGDYEADAAPADKDPYGFGYKYPNRVKLQYIGVPRDQVRKAVLATKDEYAWDVEANRYYLRHQNEFAAAPPPTSAPSTAPTTKDAFSLGQSPKAPSTAPTTRPFADVRQQCLDAVLDPLVAKLQHQIQSDVRAELTTGYRAYEEKGPATQSSTAPSAPAPAPAATASRGGKAAYDSYEFLQQLAQDIQHKYNVTLTTGSVADSFKTAKELRDLPGIGRISEFPDEATERVRTFQPADLKNTTGILALNQPSAPLNTQGDIGDVYFYRVTAADPAHKPASVDEVKDQVERDWRRLQAYELAKADANKFLEQAKANGFESAVSTSGKTMSTTSSFALNPRMPVEGYTVSTKSMPAFVRAAAAMTGELAQNKGTKAPVQLVELPADAKVAVAQLLQVESGVGRFPMQLAQDYFTQQLVTDYQRLMAADWFDYDSIVTRTGYQDLTGSRKSGSQQQQQRASAE